jgi:hypothetical protein
MAWVRPTRANHGSEQHILSIDDNAGSFNRSMLVRMGTADFALFIGPPTIFEPTSIDLNAWQHVAAVFKSSEASFYKNGVAVSWGAAPTYVSTAQTLSIGASNNGASDPFQGDIAWVAVYDRELTSLEISDSCNALKDRFTGVACN